MIFRFYQTISIAALILLLVSCTGTSESETDGVDFFGDADGDNTDSSGLHDIKATAVSGHNVRVNWKPVDTEGAKVCISRKEEGSDFVDVDCRPGSHGRFLDLALLPKTTYAYQLSLCENEICGEAAETDPVTTPKSTLPEIEITINELPENEDDLVIFPVMDFLDDFVYGAIAAIDRDGRVIWELPNTDAGRMTEIQPLTESGVILAGVLETLTGYDLDGTELFSNTEIIFHHDVDLLPDGSLLMLFWEPIPVSEDYILMGDGIQQLNPFTGESLWSWKGQDHIPFSDVNQYDIQTIWHDIGHDWTHCNALWFDEDKEAIYLNSRNLDRLYKIDYPSGEIEWSMGNGGDFGEGLFAHSHDPYFIDDNHIMIYDNGNYRDGATSGFYTRVIVVEFDEEARTAEIIWEWRDDPDIYTAGFGDAMPVGEDIFISAGAASVTDEEGIRGGKLLQVTSEGEKRWEMKMTLPYMMYKGMPISRDFFTNWGAPAPEYATYD